MISKKGKRKLEYEGMVFYWFIRQNPEGIPRLHIMSEDKKVRLNQPLFDSEVPVASGYVRQVIKNYLSGKERSKL